MVEASSNLTPSQRYAASALFAIALNQAQISQTKPLVTDHGRDNGDSEHGLTSGGDSISQDEDLGPPSFWPAPTPWHGIEEIAASSPAKHHIGALIKLLSDNDGSGDMVEKETALAKAAEAMVQGIQQGSVSLEAKKEKHLEYENECREKYSLPEAQSGAADKETESHREDIAKDSGHNPDIVEDGKPVEEAALLSHERKIRFFTSYSLLAWQINMRIRKNVHGVGKAMMRVTMLLCAYLQLGLIFSGSKWFACIKPFQEGVETMAACSAMALQKSGDKEEEESLSPESEWDKWKRGGIVGAAALTGGTLMAITGAAGAGLAGTKIARRTGEIEEFEFKAIGENHNQGRLAVEILVAGFVFKEEDFVKPWEGLTSNLERYTVIWESKNIIAVSTAIQDWLTSRVAMELMRQGAMYTVLSSLLAAMAWPATILVAADFIDSKWSIAIDRSDKAGRLLAEALRKGLQGNRPVTLVGFSLGARVVFKCLQALTETEKNAEIVERVVLLGAPISINNENWRDMVAGRFINVYATNDWTLGVAFRASLLAQGLAGIQPVCIPGIEDVHLILSPFVYIFPVHVNLNDINIRFITVIFIVTYLIPLTLQVDVTDMVEGHSSYGKLSKSLKDSNSTILTLFFETL
ncbi:hypothetical protein F2Q70_00001036 [Brassica cretica]|nr:hypothetical protein F2Q70_00001036 [Brassica cretica]